MIQSNGYGLTIKQLEEYFTLLRLAWIEENTGQEEQIPLAVILTPIIDPTKLDRAMGAEFYRKIRIRATDEMLDANYNQDTILSCIRRTICRSVGVKIDVMISVGRAEKTATLNEDDIRDTIGQFRDADPLSRPKIEIAVRSTEEDPVEIINLIEPRMTDIIPIDIEPRTSVEHGRLFQDMMHKYGQRRNYFQRLVVPV
jgi:hypothetical protein